MKTSSNSLQGSLDLWSVTLNSISNIKSGDNDRKNALREFTLTFVPLDFNEDDSNAYADSLFVDDDQDVEIADASNVQGITSASAEEISDEPIINDIDTAAKQDDVRPSFTADVRGLDGTELTTNEEAQQEQALEEKAAERKAEQREKAVESSF